MSISPELLIHSATLHPFASEDTYHKVTYSTPISLTKVRMSRAKRTLLTDLGDAKNDTLTMFFDLTHSEPSGTTFKRRDKIVYDGVDHFVREVTDPYDSTSLHHYRVALVGA